MEQWKAQMQEKHLAMLGKTSLLAGIYFIYDPFSELLANATSSMLTTCLHVAFFVLMIYWMQKFLLVAAHNTTNSGSYTDEYARATFQRACYWTLHVVMTYLAIIWSSNWWLEWIGTPEINLIGQVGFGLGLLSEGIAVTWLLYQDNQQLETAE